MSDSQQQEDNYTKIPNGFLEALCRVRIPAEARQVLDVIMRYTFGFRRISFQDEDSKKQSIIAKMTGLSKQRIYDARKKLIEMNMITVTKNRYQKTLTYSIQSDFTQWSRKTVTIDGNGKPLPGVTENRYQNQKWSRKTVTDPLETISNDKVSQGAKESIKKRRKKEGARTREKYGEYVLLSPAEYLSLTKRFGGERLADLIEDVNWYCARKGKTYTDYRAAILTFDKRDRKKNGETKDNGRASKEQQLKKAVTKYRELKNSNAGRTPEEDQKLREHLVNQYSLITLEELNEALR